MRRFTLLFALALGLGLGACEDGESAECMWSGEDVDRACLDGCVLSRVICQETDVPWDDCVDIEAECMRSCGG